VLIHPKDDLDDVFAFALLGGVAIYLLGHVAVRLRGAHTVNRRRLGVAVLLLALFPLAGNVPALIAVAGVVAILAGLIAVETRSYGEARAQFRHEFAVQGVESSYSPADAARDAGVP
jgi:low temperature requirement protein LtrA